MHINEPLLLIGKSSPCGGSGLPLSLSEWSFTICLTIYSRKLNVLSVSLNKTCSSLFKLWIVTLLSPYQGSFLSSFHTNINYEDICLGISLEKRNVSHVYFVLASRTAVHCWKILIVWFYNSHSKPFVLALDHP